MSIQYRQRRHVDRPLSRWMTTSSRHKLVTARPLPAGTYRAYYRTGWASSHRGMRQGLVVHGNESRRLATLTVTAPRRDRTLHEAFFDPVDIGTAVGAVGSNGVLKPDAFALEWHDNHHLQPEVGRRRSHHDPQPHRLTRRLRHRLHRHDRHHNPQPHVRQRQHHRAGTWTVPDKPWSDGDLLMLRIHKPISTDATLSALAPQRRRPHLQPRHDNLRRKRPRHHHTDHRNPHARTSDAATYVVTDSAVSSTMRDNWRVSPIERQRHHA